MLRYVSAVQPQPLLADPDRVVRVHLFEGALRAVRVFAQLAVKVVVNGEYQPSGGAYAGSGVRAGREARVRLLGENFSLGRHGR